MSYLLLTRWVHFRKHSAALAALTVLGIFGLNSAANAADEPVQTRGSQSAEAVQASIDGAEIFTREWIPGDRRSHGGDGLGPVFNDSSCVACHNQGGTGGAGPASKNVDIVTAFHAPQQHQRQQAERFNIPQTLPGIVFQSVFGNLDSIPAQAAANHDVQPATSEADEPQLTPAERAAAEQKKQAELRKMQMEADRKVLTKLHPGFAFANSVVLHKGATFSGYENWRSQVAGMPFGSQQRLGVEVQMFAPQVAAAEEAPTTRTQRSNGATVMAQLRQQVQVARQRGMNASSRQGNFVITRSQRNTTALFGAGLIDSIPTSILEELEAAQAKNKVVSGRVARLKDGSAGRFGWKAQKARLDSFVMTACAVEVGLNVPDHPQAGHPQNADYIPAGLDLNQAQCDALIEYITELPTPQQRLFGDEIDEGYIKGGHALFARVGCADCHVENVGEVAGIFSDLLLHDMGGELGDTGSYDVFIPNSTPEGDIIDPIGLPTQQTRESRQVTGATRQEWRTPALWGVRDSAPYLHDGRAENLEQAIAMHGGESARSAQQFFALSDAERFQVISFLKSLVAPTPQVASAR
tara:strand:- start:169043 stop:170785 length:1743 start_codon:yes stop_codon:yes gene_type:complete